MRSCKCGKNLIFGNECANCTRHRKLREAILNKEEIERRGYVFSKVFYYKHTHTKEQALAKAKLMIKKEELLKTAGDFIGYIHIRGAEYTDLIVVAKCFVRHATDKEFNYYFNKFL